MKTPSIIAVKKIFIETDVVDYEIPLLLSKDAMKKAGMSIKECHERKKLLLRPLKDGIIN